MAGDIVASIEIRLNSTSRISSIAVRNSRRIIYTLKEDNGSPVNISHIAQLYNTLQIAFISEVSKIMLSLKKSIVICTTEKVNVQSNQIYRLIIILKTYLSTNRYISVHYINTVICHRSVCKYRQVTSSYHYFYSISLSLITYRCVSGTYYVPYGHPFMCTL